MLCKITMLDYTEAINNLHPSFTEMLSYRKQSMINAISQILHRGFAQLAIPHKKQHCKFLPKFP